MYLEQKPLADLLKKRTEQVIKNNSNSFIEKFFKDCGDKIEKEAWHAANDGKYEVYVDIPKVPEDVQEKLTKQLMSHYNFTTVVFERKTSDLTDAGVLLTASLYLAWD